eukprot:15276652-Alexandrium_andersonii.AAC.1
MDAAPNHSASVHSKTGKGNLPTTRRRKQSRRAMPLRPRRPHHPAPRHRPAAQHLPQRHRP